MDEALKDAQPLLVVGYQFKKNGRYNGVYIFQNNLDREEIHLPPMTTLVAPPPIETLPEGYEHAWDGAQWIQRPSTKPDTVPIDLRTEPDEPKMPTGRPEANSNGEYPRCVLNAEGTAYEWVYPEPTLLQKAVAAVKGLIP